MIQKSPGTFALLALAVLLAGCAARTPEPVSVPDQIPEEARPSPEPVVTLEVPRPCTARVPERPNPLPADLPTHPVALAALLGAKLAEYSAPGKYADQAEAYFRACPPTR